MWYLTEERELVMQSAREFAEKELKPCVPDMEKNMTMPKKLLKRMGELGFSGLAFPAEKGGSGVDMVAAGLVTEELSKVSPTAGFTYTINTFSFAVILDILGTDEQKEKWLKPNLAGEIDFAMPTTEPPGMANFPEHQTTAVREGNEWVINGGKIFTSNRENADFFMMGCLTGTPNLATGEGYSLFMIPKGTPGLEVGKTENKLGLHGSSTGMVYANNVRVPKENLLGPEGKYIGAIWNSFPYEYALFGACGIGGATAVYEKTLQYTKERIQRGVSLFDTYQSIRDELCKIRMEIDLCRAGLYTTLDMMNSGKDAFAQSCGLKVKGTELLESVTSRCISLHGGNGVVVENGLASFLGDGKVLQIAGGASGMVLSNMALVL